MNFAHSASVPADEVAPGVVYIEGPLCALIFLVLVFFYVAKSDSGWGVGVGLLTVAVVAGFAVLNWAMLSDRMSP